MQSEDDESDTWEDDQYQVVILHSDSQTRLAEAICESMQNIDMGNSTFQLKIRTLEGIGSPGRTMVDILNHVFEKSTFVMFPRCAEFFKDRLNKFAVSACLEDRIQHTDPKRHWTFIPLDIEKKFKIKRNPIINSLTGITISSCGSLSKGQEGKVRKLLGSKLDIPREAVRSDEARVEIKEAIVKNTTRQVEEICKLVLSADCPADEQQRYDKTEARSARQMPCNRETSDTFTTKVTGHTAGLGSQGVDAGRSTSPRSERLCQSSLTAQVSDESLLPNPCPPQTETLHPSSLTSTASGRNPQPMRNVSPPKSEDLHQSSPASLAEGRNPQLQPRLSHATMLHAKTCWPETVNTPPSFPSSYNRWDTATNGASHPQFPSGCLPQSVELDNSQSVYFCVPRLKSTTPNGNASFYNIANTPAQQGFIYGQTPQHYTTHFQNPNSHQAVPIRQVCPQPQWQYPNGASREYWNRLGARPKTGNAAYCDPAKLHQSNSMRCNSVLSDTGQGSLQLGDQSFPSEGFEAATRRCDSAPVEGQVRHGDFVPGQNTRSCTSSLERGPADADRRNRERIDSGFDGEGVKIRGARVKDTVQGQHETSAHKHSDLPSPSTQGLEADKGSAHTASYLPSSSGTDTENTVFKHDSTAGERPCGEEELASCFNPTQHDRKEQKDINQEREASVKSTKHRSSTDEKELKGDSDRLGTEKGTRDTRKTKCAQEASEHDQDIPSRERQDVEKADVAMVRAFPSLDGCFMTNAAESERNINPQSVEAELALPPHPPLKVPLGMSHKVPLGSEEKQEDCGRCCGEDSSRELQLQPSGTLSSASPEVSGHDTALLGSFPELEEVVSQMSECSLTPPTSRKFGDNRLTFSSLEQDCAPSGHSEQEKLNGSACLYRHQQSQGRPGQHCPSPQEVDILHQRQLQQPQCQQQWQQELMRPQQLPEQHQRPQLQNRQPHQQNWEGKGLAELNAAGRSLNQARSSTDTDSGRGTI